MSFATKEFLDKYPMQYEFSLHEHKKELFKKYPPLKNSHGETFTRRIRENRYGKGYGIICHKPAQSKYKKVTEKECIEFYKEKDKRAKAKKSSKIKKAKLGKRKVA